MARYCFVSRNSILHENCNCIYGRARYVLFLLISVRCAAQALLNYANVNYEQFPFVLFFMIRFITAIVKKKESDDEECHATCKVANVFKLNTRRRFICGFDFL